MTKRKTPRNTTKYQFKVGNKIVNGGITDRDLSERENEHKSSGKKTVEKGKTFDWSKGKIVKVGKKTTREGGLNWERKNGYGANQK